LDLLERRRCNRQWIVQDRSVVTITLVTSRLLLEPITLAVVEAMLAGRRADAETLVDAALPNAWPGRALIERAFYAKLSAIRDNPDVRLWGDRVMITRQGERRVVGSVVFHGAPDENGAVEIAYGVEQDAQGLGYATEATRACVDWALARPEVRAVRATTPPWHAASRRVLDKLGMKVVGTREHELLGDLLEYECLADHPLSCAI
jgi:RimJ/RimL family protein N-acetyltransferase